MKRVPAAVSSLLLRLTAGFRTILDRNLVGIYLYGSLTQRAFQKAHSDIDCEVVTLRKLSQSQFVKLERWLAKEAESDPWVKRLQIQFVLRNQALHLNAPAALYQFGRLSRTTSDGNPIIWINILESGIVLHGPQPKSFLPPITREAFTQALEREIGYLRAEIIEKPTSEWRNVSFYRVYAVLTLCRILYSFQRGSVVSKPRAARWALRTLPEKFHPLIHKALEPGANSGSPHLDLRHIAKLIDFVETQMKTGARADLR